MQKPTHYIPTAKSICIVPQTFLKVEKTKHENFQILLTTMSECTSAYDMYVCLQCLNVHLIVRLTSLEAR